MIDFTNKLGSESKPAGESEPSEEIILLYQQHVPEYLSDLNAALESGDETAIQFQCHKISSAVKIMGFDNIALQLDTIQAARPQGEELQRACKKAITQISHTLLLLGK